MERRFYTLFKGLFLDEIREFQRVFWMMVFPLILYFILVSALGNMGNEGVSFKLGIVKEENLSGFGKIIDEVLKGITSEEGPFIAIEFVDRGLGLEALRKNKIDALLVVPKGINAGLARAFIVRGKVEPPNLEVYYAEGRQASEISADVLSQILEQVNLEIARQQKKDFRTFEVKENIVSSPDKKTFDYAEYLFPGIVLMMILSVSLFSAPIRLMVFRNSGVHKKLYTTPIKPLEYFAAYLLKLFVVIILSFISILFVALFVYRVEIPVFSCAFLFSFLYSILVLLSMGLMFASFIKKLSTANVVGQIANQLMMFLGGLYFPVFNIPWTMRWLVYAIPTTYLAELTRRSLGYRIAPIPDHFLIIVPAIWLVTSVVIFSLNFKKVMGYE